MLDQDHDNSSTTPEGSAGDSGDTGSPGAGGVDTGSPDAGVAPKKATRKRAAKKAVPAAEAAGGAAAETPAQTGDQTGDQPGSEAPAAAPAKKTASRTRKKAAATAEAPAPADESAAAAEPTAEAEAAAPAKKTAKKAAKKTTRTTKKAAAAPEGDAAPETAAADTSEAAAEPARASTAVPLFQAPETTPAPARRTRARTAKKATAADTETQTETETVEPEQAAATAPPTDDTAAATDEGDGEGVGRRKRRRGGRRRRKGGEGSEGASDSAEAGSADQAEAETTEAQESETPAEGEGGTSRRRRRRRRAGEEGADASDDPANTVTRVRSGRSANDEITAVSGSTRLEAKKQRRREGREAGRRRAPIVSEAEFLARRESVNRVMVVRQRADVTQIGVLEDNVLVEHYVARESQTSLIGNVYLGRVQNVLPSMEAAFIDIGKGRNAVLYAGEVNWSALGHKDGQPRKIESVLSSGQSVLVQVTKDPIGHKGARLTSQVSLAGRFLVYVPDGTTSGISRKLPDTERNRLKTLLKEIVPDTAGVIVRTAAEGASEDELTRDVERLKARWEDIEKKAKGSAPQLLYGEPDLTLKVVRDLFTEDFAKLVIQGDDAWDTVQGYVAHVAPDLEERLERYQPKNDQDVFSAYRIDEQIKKGLDRKVWLPSGGSLVIDRTEAMTVVDVNTGKFTGSGGNLEETVTKNNLEAAEEIVRQLRLRDIGGIIVVDFIDMVLESNRDLVLRRLVECLGRDRTRHQVAEVTSLGLVQMTRKRIGTGLLESFSHDCTACHGRGVVIEEAPVEPKRVEEETRRGGGTSSSSRRSRSRGKGQDAAAETTAETTARGGAPSPKDLAAMPRHEQAADEQHADDEAPADEQPTAESPVEEPTTDEQPADEQPTAESAPEPEPETEPSVPEEPEAAAPQPPAAPEPPRVVTRTRRRAASRPAGPPAAATDGEAAPAAAATVPPAMTGVAGTPPTDGRVEPGTAAEEPGTPETTADGGHEGGPALHVPVKRKGGARKR